jgi:hypothetical protein
MCVAARRLSGDCKVEAAAGRPVDHEARMHSERLLLEVIDGQPVRVLQCKTGGNAINNRSLPILGSRLVWQSWAMCSSSRDQGNTQALPTSLTCDAESITCHNDGHLLESLLLAHPLRVNTQPNLTHSPTRLKQLMSLPQPINSQRECLLQMALDCAIIDQSCQLL